MEEKKHETHLKNLAGAEELEIFLGTGSREGSRWVRRGRSRPPVCCCLLPFGGALRVALVNGDGQGRCGAAIGWNL